jgi:hypothetical protein
VKVNCTRTLARQILTNFGDQLSSKNDFSFAIVTPTYWRDLTRCELLAESIDRCVPEIPHYLIVDRRDKVNFKHLERGKRRLIESEELVSNLFWRIPGKSSRTYSGLDPSAD